MGIIFHYLDQDLKVRNLLANVRHVKKHHTGENITKAIILIL